MIRYPVSLLLDMMMNFAYFYCIFTGAKYFSGAQSSHFGENAADRNLAMFDQKL